MDSWWRGREGPDAGISPVPRACTGFPPGGTQIRGQNRHIRDWGGGFPAATRKAGDASVPASQLGADGGGVDTCDRINVLLPGTQSANNTACGMRPFLPGAGGTARAPAECGARRSRPRLVPAGLGSAQDAPESRPPHTRDAYPRCEMRGSDAKPGAPRHSRPAPPPPRRSSRSRASRRGSPRATPRRRKRSCASTRPSWTSRAWAGARAAGTSTRWPCR